MPPHWLHAGPRSRPLRRAGTTGGVSVMASAAAFVVAGWMPATVERPGVPAGGGLGSATEAGRAGGCGLVLGAGAAVGRAGGVRADRARRRLGRLAGADLGGEDAQLL